MGAVCLRLPPESFSQATGERFGFDLKIAGDEHASPSAPQSSAAPPSETDEAYLHQKITVLGRRKRGPKPSSLHKQAAKTAPKSQLPPILIDLKIPGEDPGERARREHDAAVKKTERIRKRHDELAGDLLTKNRAVAEIMESNVHALDGLFWMARACGWDVSGETEWHWWAVLIEFYNRISLWDLTMEGIAIEREIGESKGLPDWSKKGSRVLRRW